MSKSNYIERLCKILKVAESPFKFLKVAFFINHIEGGLLKSVQRTPQK